MAKYRVLLVDDDRFVLDALSTFLSSDPELEVAATASNGVEALAILTARDCDVIVSDIEMPVMDGRQLLKEVQKMPSPPVFVTMTAFAHDGTLVEMLSHGAAAYLAKSDRAQDIRDIIRVAVSGGTALSPLAMSHLRSILPVPRAQSPSLTPTQNRVLGLVCEGAANRDIAEVTGLSLPSVKKNVSQLLEVFNATSRTQLVADFYRRGGRPTLSWGPSPAVTDTPC